jgi:hypothetical protein
MLEVGGRARSSARGPGAARGGLAAGGWCRATGSAPIVIMLQVSGWVKSSAGGLAERAAAAPPVADAGRPARRRS